MDGQVSLVREHNYIMHHHSSPSPLPYNLTPLTSHQPTPPSTSLLSYHQLLPYHHLIPHQQIRTSGLSPYLASSSFGVTGLRLSEAGGRALALAKEGTYTYEGAYTKEGSAVGGNNNNVGLNASTVSSAEGGTGYYSESRDGREHRGESEGAFNPNVTQETSVTYATNVTNLTNQTMDTAGLSSLGAANEVRRQIVPYIYSR